MVLDTVFNDRKSEDVLVSQLFRDRVGNLNDAPVDRLLAWCDGDQDRIAKVAKAVRAYTSNEPDKASLENPKHVVLSEHIKSLLEVASDKLTIIEIILKNTWPASWSGSRAEILEVHSKAFAELFEYPDQEIRSFVRTRLDLLEQDIRRVYEREAAEHNEREQRFE